jgi:hypothetical protein
MKEGNKVGMNSNELLLKKVALKTALEKNLITLHKFNQEMTKMNDVEKRLSALEKRREELIKQAKRKLNSELVHI